MRTPKRLIKTRSILGKRAGRVGMESQVPNKNGGSSGAQDGLIAILEGVCERRKGRRGGKSQVSKRATGTIANVTPCGGDE